MNDRDRLVDMQSSCKALRRRGFITARTFTTGSATNASGRLPQGFSE